MEEVFSARPSEVAGMGKLASEIGLQTMACHRYIGDHAGVSDTLPGQLLQRLAPFISVFQENTRSRHVHLSAHCSYIGDELRKAAWLYHDAEKETYDQLNAHTDLVPVPVPQPGNSETAAVGNVADYGNPADYGKPAGIDYPPPNPAVDDTRETIQAAAAWLGDVDETIFELTDWSPLTEVTTPLSGNWNEIRRVGEAFDIAGSAMESAAVSLERGVRRVDDYWDGQAAQAFSEYSGRQIAAMYWEGPCGRTIHAISEVIADEIREGVHAVVRKFAEMLEAEVDLGSGSAALKVALKKVPVVGTAWQLGAIIDILRKTIDLTMDLVRRIEELVDQFGQFLDAIIDPENQVSRTIDKYLQPFNEALDKGKVAVDAGKTADIRPILDTPEDRFSVGDGDEPWKDAV